MEYKNIMRLIPTIQATHLAGQNLKAMKNKPMKTKEMMRLGVKNIVGTTLIKTESDLISLI
jgi:hypothetical protein